MLVLVSGLSGFLARDWWLGEAVTKREKQLVAEFPALAEMMALIGNGGRVGAGGFGAYLFDLVARVGS